MKKRMLITAIVMVVVLAVALTTSSLAWFSATQNNVTASGGSFTASTGSSASNVNISLSRDMSSWKNGIALLQQSTEMLPVCVNKPTENAVFEGDFDSFKLDTGKTVNAYFKPDTIAQQEVLLDNTFDGENYIPKGNSNQSHYYQDAILLINNETAVLRNLEFAIKTTITKTSETAEFANPIALIRVSKLDSANKSWTQLDAEVITLSEVNGRYIVYDLYSLYNANSDFDYLIDNYAIINATTSTQSSSYNPTVSAPTDDGLKMTSNGTITLSLGDDGLSNKDIVKIDIVMWYDGNGLNTYSQNTVTEFDLTITGKTA